MNPMKWKPEHRAALAIGAAIGGTLGALVSWVMAYPSTSRVTTPIKWWVEHYGDQLLVSAADPPATGSAPEKGGMIP